jgi:hypothetical protein
MKSIIYSRGWAFLDILIGLFLLGLILITVFGNIAWASMLSKQAESKMIEIVERRNKSSIEQTVEYSKEIFKE